MELINVNGVGEKMLAKLNELKINTVYDLIDFMPISYIDMTKELDFSEVVVGEYALIKVKIDTVTRPMKSKNNTTYVRAVGTSDGYNISFVWFSMPYVSTTLSTGDWLMYGSVTVENGKYSMINPTFDKLGSSKMSGIRPIYPLRGKISNTTFNKMAASCLDKITCINHLPKVFNIQQAYAKTHTPETIQDMITAQHTLCMYQLVKDLLAYRMTRVGKAKNDVKGYLYPMHEEMALPYNLSISQKQTVQDILTDMTSDDCMNRLVLGDVGSGKTVVALLAMATVSTASGGQSVMMAPTEILCRQHYNNALSMMSQHGYKMAILTASTKGVERALIIKDLILGKINMLFSTHSCINDNIIFDNLKLCVIDELHKFGVEQRAKLINKGVGVSVLSLSATPVPRTLAMSMYGDLDISYLYKRQEAASNIKTYIFHSDKLEKMYQYMADKVSKGSRCFVVCPRLKANDTADILSCHNMFDLLKKNYIDSSKIAILYGSQSIGDKTDAMQKFTSGQVQVLVCTTVIEVGIDVREADTIFILGSEHHGLATLHQLRGRVGRDGRASECFMHVRAVTTPVRIEAMKNCDDGIKLAEIDAKTRGYGDMIGTRQSGANAYSKYNVAVSIEMIKKAKVIADMIDLASIDAKEMTADILRAEKTILN